MDKSSTYCTISHLGMAVQNQSDFCSCNVNKESWQNSKKEAMHVYSHPIKTAFKSHTRKIIAAALDHNIKHPSCQVCWDLEETGKDSFRQNYNKKFGNITPLPDQPRILVIKPGNTCNYACRMCNPTTSSSWYSDGYELEKANLTSSSWYSDGTSSQVANITFNEYTKTFDTIRNSFNRDNTEFWHTLKEWISNLVYIDIYGGEPFLVPAMFDLLEHGVNIGASQNIEINIHTNASIFNEQYLKILSQYKKINFHVSIDSMIPAQFEYIRYKSNYASVIENSKKFKEFIKDYPNILMSITNTITPLNVFYIDNTTKDLSSMFRMPVQINLVTTPEYDIRHLPIPVKQHLINNLSTGSVVNFLKQSIPGCDVEWPKFCQTTNKLDQLRRQRFAEIFPEWWNMLNPHWVYNNTELTCT